jgi:uncharacterized membrane protein
MSTIIKSIEVDVPVSRPYAVWTRFEDLPCFLRGVREVRRLDEHRLYWRAEIAGVQREWEIEIVEQVPERRITWRSRSGPRTWGAVIFEPRPDDTTRVIMEMHFDPEGFLAIVSDYLGLSSYWVQRCLQQFKEQIEEMDRPSSGLPPHDQLVGQ